MGILDSGSRDYLDRIGFHAGSEPSVAGLETGFKDNFTASAENFRMQHKSTSESDAMNDLINHQLDLIYAHNNPDFRFNPKHKDGLNIKRDLTGKEKAIMVGTKALLPLMGSAALSPGANIFDFGYDGKKKRFQEMTNQIIDIQAQNPNTKIKTWDQIMDDARDESQRLKEVFAQVSSTRTWGGVAGMFTGVMKEALTDPYVLASMTLGWKKITGGTKSMNAAIAFLSEFSIVAGSEAFVQAKVLDWSAKLETPWSLKDAVVTILTVGGFAGVTRAAGSYVVDVLEATKASKILRSEGETVKADTLDNFIDLFNGAPAARDVLDQDLQLKVIDDLQKAFDSGRVGDDLNVEIERIIKDRPEFSMNAERELQIDRALINIEGNNFGYPAVKNVLDDNDPLIRIDTKTRHTTKSGEYTIVRQKLHTTIIDGFLNEGQIPAKGEKPVAILMGGGSASGKGTLLSQLIGNGVIPKKGFVRIDPDLVKESIPAYKKITDAGDHRAANLAHAESSDVALSLRQQAMNENKHMIIDKTLGNPEKAKALIKELKDAGYDVKLIGVTVDPGEALVRNLLRFMKESRMVPPGALLEIHKGFNKNFKAYAKQVGEGRLYDTTGKVPKLIAKIKDGKIKIVSKEEYNKLTARGKLNEKATTHQELADSQGIRSQFGQSKAADGADNAGAIPGGDRSADSGTSRSSPKNDTPKIDTGTRPVLDDPELPRLMDEEFIEAQRIIDDVGSDLEIPFTVIDDLGNEVTLVQGVKKVFNDIENDEKALASLNKCMGRAA
jgi:predicted ABC-type ATPase